VVTKVNFHLGYSNQSGSGNTGSGNINSYSPIGRAGVYQFEIESPNGADFYQWNGIMWVYLPNYDDFN